MRDQDADCVAKPCCTSRCCNSMGSRAFCDTQTGGDAHWVCTGLHPRDERTKPGEAPQDAPHDVLGRRDAVGGTPSLCQEPSETDAGTSTLVGNAPLSVQNRTNLPDTLSSFVLVIARPCSSNCQCRVGSAYGVCRTHSRSAAEPLSLAIGCHCPPSRSATLGGTHSCLTPILACVIYWQAREISRIVRWCKSQDGTIDIALLDHESPIEWNNVILYGQYLLDRAQVRRSRSLKDIFAAIWAVP